MVTTIQIEEKENHPQYAGFWIRFGAWAIDSIILGIPLLFFSNIIFALFISSMEIPNELLLDPASINALSDSEILSLLGSIMTAFLERWQYVCLLVFFIIHCFMLLNGKRQLERNY